MGSLKATDAVTHRRYRDGVTRAALQTINKDGKRAHHVGRDAEGRRHRDALRPRPPTRHHDRGAPEERHVAPREARGAASIDKVLAAGIDHTNLKARATRDAIDKLCEEAGAYGFRAVCVVPTWRARRRSCSRGRP